MHIAASDHSRTTVDVPNDQRICVAIVAEHASARFGGEAMLPLQYFRHLRKRGVDTYLVVHSRTRPELDGLFPEDRDRIFYVPDTWLHKMLWWVGTPLPDRIRTFTVGWLLHMLTQAYQKPIVRRLVRERGVNVVHEPIPVSPRMPSLMYGVGAPVIIGPMNGGMSFPPGFRYMESPIERLFLGLGRWISGLANWLIPGKRHAALLLVANERTRSALPRGVCPKVLEVVDNGIDTETWAPPERDSRIENHSLRFAFVGRLIALKGVDVLLEAFAQVAWELKCHLHIIGDGPERTRLERWQSALVLHKHVTFYGLVPHSTCCDLLAQMDALVFPSLRDCGGAVVLEAMAMGIPVIATKWGGPADYVNDECGFLVTPINRPQFVDDLAQAMRKMCILKETRAQMGHSARIRVKQLFSWDAKVGDMLACYRKCICMNREQ